MFFVSPHAHAQTILMPSLDQAMQHNDQLLKQQWEERKNTTSVQIQPQFTPALTDNFTYQTVFTGQSTTLKKADQANLYIQEIDLTKGAQVTSALEVASYNEKTGEPQFVKKNVNEALSSLTFTPTTLINGQFFNPLTQPSELSFGLKSDGIIRTAGADNGTKAKNILHIGNGFSEVLPYSWANLEATTGSFAIGNLSTASRHYATSSIGRTYMCVANPDSNNRSSKLLVAVAESMTEGMLENEIYKMGCTPRSTAKLDSSGSSRIWYNGNSMYGVSHKGDPDGRKIPHYIAIYDK